MQGHLRRFVRRRHDSSFFQSVVLNSKLVTWARVCLAVRPGFRILLAVSLGSFLAGCNSSPTCETLKGDYRFAKDQPPLRVPEGMAQPDRSAALVVPPAATNAAPQQPQRGACLESPPSYFGSAGRVARTPEQVVASWAQDWADRNADGVLAVYSDAFVAPSDAGRGPWLSERREQIATGPVPSAQLEDLQVRNEGDDRRIVSFKQRFGSNTLRKELTLLREANSWRIVAERVLDVQ